MSVALCLSSRKLILLLTLLFRVRCLRYRSAALSRAQETSWVTIAQEKKYFEYASASFSDCDIATLD